MAIRRRGKGESFEGDPLIPIMNLVCMLIPLLLYSAIFVRFNTLEVAPPKQGETGENIEESLNLTVVITDRGFHFKINPKHRLPWMSQAIGTASPDIPKLEDDWDFSTLTKKLREIKSNHSAQTRINVGAEDNISYDVLIKTMDYARGEGKPLFPDVTLTRGVV